MHNQSVSIAKGIGIVLMVLGHASFVKGGYPYIAMFHMPLFFFFSGYCFKVVYLDDFKGYARSKLKRIYSPYVKYSLLFLLLHNVFLYIGIYNCEFSYNGTVQHFYSESEIVIKGMRIAITMTGHEQLLGGFWFLHTLFLSSFMAFFVIWICTQRLRISVGWGGGVVLLMNLLFLYYELKIPLISFGGCELLACFFILIGYMYSSKQLAMERKHGLMVAIGIVLIAVGVQYWRCDMLSLTWQKLFPYMVSALGGTLMIFSMSDMLVKNKTVSAALDFIGSNTLAILTWHFLCFKLVSLIIIRVNGLPISWLAVFPVMIDYSFKGWWIAYFIAGVGIPCGFVLCKRYRLRKLI